MANETIRQALDQGIDPLKQPQDGGGSGFGRVLQALGAGLTGQLPQFQAQQAAQRQERTRLSNERLQAASQDAAVGLDHLENGRIDQLKSLLTGRIENISSLGGDPSDTVDELNDVNAGSFDKVKKSLQGAVRSGQIRGFLPDTPQSKFLKIVGNKALFQTPDGKLEAQDIEGLNISGGETRDVQSSKALPGGAVQLTFKNGDVELVSPSEADALKITQAEERGARLQGRRAEQRERGGKQERSAQELIDRGSSAAESTATIRRGLKLLETIKTGGAAAISLAARQRLGIEGADEGELSASLGKSVLSQLRETFGAAFTAQEGDQLKKIEAGIGKSTETNKRLLQRALKIAEKTSARAVRAARRRGDDERVQDIEELLKFELTFEEDENQAQQIPTSEQNQPQSVIRFDRTGQRIQ